MKDEIEASQMGNLKVKRSQISSMPDENVEWIWKVSMKRK
jgi:hypothetical protein